MRPRSPPRSLWKSSLRASKSIPASAGIFFGTMNPGVPPRKSAHACYNCSMANCGECNVQISSARDKRIKYCPQKCLKRSERRRRAFRHGRRYSLGSHSGRRRITHGTCRVCGSRTHRSNFRLNKNGKICLSVCVACRRSGNSLHTSTKYGRYKQKKCTICGFAGHKCQLDVHHIDGIHSNHRPENLTTLCANCHRLVTYNERQKRLYPSSS